MSEDINTRPTLRYCKEGRPKLKKNTINVNIRYMFLTKKEAN